MTRRRVSGYQIFSCNREGCGAEFKSAAPSPQQAWREAKAAGWITAKIGPVWYHWCSWVHRPNRDSDVVHKGESL